MKEIIKNALTIGLFAQYVGLVAQIELLLKELIIV
jgi:hypothetical protein